VQRNLLAWSQIHNTYTREGAKERRRKGEKERRREGEKERKREREKERKREREKFGDVAHGLGRESLQKWKKVLCS